MPWSVGSPAPGDAVEVPREEWEQHIIRPGRFYRFVFIVDGDAEQHLPWIAADIINRVRSEYPGITVNYVEVSGNRVVVEVYDPPGAHPALAVPISIIILAIAAVLAVWGLTVLVEKAYQIVKVIAGPPEAPPWESPLWLLAVAAALAAAAYLIQSLRR